jgi:hypothetical protein
MDVKITFMNVLKEEEVYINQLRGFEVHGINTHVCRLKKALYGLKQAPCAWYSRIDKKLLKLHFTNIAIDLNIYYLYIKFDLLVLVLYVDNLILAGSSRKLIAWCKKLTREYEKKDISIMHYFSDG